MSAPIKVGDFEWLEREVQHGLATITEADLDYCERFISFRWKELEADERALKRVGQLLQNYEKRDERIEA